MDAFIAGAIAGYGIAIPVGAIAILIVDMSMRCGLTVGFMAGAGAATADLLYAALAATGGLLLVSILQPILTPLQIVSGVVLLGMGLVGLWRSRQTVPVDSDGAQVCGPFRMYSQFVGLTLINPLTLVYFTALIVGGGGGLDGTRDKIYFIVGAGLASLSWQTLLAAMGAVVRHQLSPAFQRSAAIFGNLVVLGLGANLLINIISR